MERVALAQQPHQQQMHRVSKRSLELQPEALSRHASERVGDYYLLEFGTLNPVLNVVPPELAAADLVKPAVAV